MGADTVLVSYWVDDIEMKRELHNGECCDLPKGTDADLCWFRKPTFAENHPKVNALMKLFGRKQGS